MTNQSPNSFEETAANIAQQLGETDTHPARANPAYPRAAWR